MEARVLVPPAFVDTHCHLDDPAFADMLEDVLAQSRQRGVDRWVVVGFEPERWDSTLSVVRQHAGMAHMLGVHPGSADQWNAETRDSLATLVSTTRPVAIGEIGLDFHRGETNLAAQLGAFHQQLDLALDHELPAVIHMRSAEEQILRAIRARSALPHLLFHSFEGSQALRDLVIERGFTIGVGGLATRTASGALRDLIRTIPLAQIVLESDAPYLVPKGARGRNNVPGNVAVIGAMLADLLGASVDAIAAATTQTAERLFPAIAHVGRGQS